MAYRDDIPILTSFPMHLSTQLIHAGRRSAAHSQSVNPPLVRASTIVYPTLQAFKKSYTAKVFESLRYGRSGTSTTFELQEAMAQIEETETALAFASGLAAITAVLAAYAKPQTALFLSAGVYGPTRIFCERELVPLGVEIAFFNSTAELAALFNNTTLPVSLVYVEVPASLTFDMQDIPALCEIAHLHGVPVASDSTWGTPVFFRPHGLGIDISIHAATKYINGHSDVMLGLVTGSYAALEPVRQWCDRYGSHVAPDVCWLALRGLRTLALRMQQHDQSALVVANWLREQAAIKKVLFPAMPEDPGYALWKKQFSGAPGPFSVELQPCSEDAFERFINAFQLFSLGTSWGSYESLVMPALPHGLRAHSEQPAAGRLVRFHIGLEQADDLCADIAQAFVAMNQESA